MKEKKIRLKRILNIVFSVLKLVSGASEAAVSLGGNIIVKGDAIFHKNALREPVAFGERNCFSLVRVIGDFDKYMSFVIRIIIIAVNNPDGVIHLQAKFKAKTASGIEF